MEVVEQRLRGLVEYNTDLFDTSTIQRMAGHYQLLLERFVANPQRRLSDIPLLSEAEYYQQLVEWNATTTTYPRNACIPELFEHQVQQRPEAIALVYAHHQLTYQELDRQASRLAVRLQRRGVGPEQVVGVCMERSLELIIALLAILKAGGAYLPLDPAYPAERLAFMLEDAQVRLLLTQPQLRERLSEQAVSLLYIQAGPLTLPPELPGVLTPLLSGEQLAYVMYTSGSTGRPKGVCVTHRNVVRLVYQDEALPVRTQEVFWQFAPSSFDASTFEIWSCLLHGARLVICASALPSLAQLAHELDYYAISTLWLTAALFHQMVEAHTESVSRVPRLLAGGEALERGLVHRLLQQSPRGHWLYNGYGPTEGTTFSCWYPMPSGEPPEEILGPGTSVPIGRPLANTQVYVLDRSWQPVPIGVPGELYIGGEGVVRGYWQRPELTAQRFIPDPCSAQPGQRLYHTGDLVRYRADGVLEFLGRTDEQIKLRGYRIEPGEIEAVIGSQPGVSEAVVLLREDRPADRRLVAYVVPAASAGEDGAVALSLGQLRHALHDLLPEYMLPTAWIVLDELPLTPNGKVDRRALPPPEIELSEPLQESTPRTPTEEMLADIWSQVLQVESLGIFTNFFEVGGHSLLATRVISQVREVFQIDLPLRTLFEAPTIADFAKAIVQSHIEQTDDDELAQIMRELGELSDDEVQMMLATEKPTINQTKDF